MRLRIELRQPRGDRLIFFGRSEDCDSLPRVGDRIRLETETIVVKSVKYSFHEPDLLEIMLEHDHAD